MASTGSPGSRPRPGSGIRGRVLVDVFVVDVPLPGDVAGVADAAADRVEREMEHSPRLGDDVLFDQRGSPMSFAPNMRAIWPTFGPCVTHDDWMLGMLSEVEPRGDRLRPEVLEGARPALAVDASRPSSRRADGAGRECVQEMNAVKPAGLVLELPDAVEVLRPAPPGSRCGRTIIVAGRAAAEFVPDLVARSSQPSVRTLPRSCALRTRSTRISPPPPGQAAEARRLEPFERRS